MKNGFLILKAGKTVPEFPERIISLVPSQTELLHDLGAGARVIGITKFCIHPDHWFRSKCRVGGTKAVDPEKVKALHPDLILANKEENEQEQIEQLAALAPVYVTDVRTPEDAWDMIRQVGMLIGKAAHAERLVRDIQTGFRELQAGHSKVQSAAYLIWREPWMTVGKDTFIHSLMAMAGFRNVFADCERYPEVRLAGIAARKPDVVLLSSEPYPFKEKHIAEVSEAIPQAHILLVDGELFSWYGSRLLHAPAYFKTLK